MILRSLIAALVFVCAVTIACAQTGSVKTPSQLNSEVNSTYPDNSAGAITPFAIRQTSLDQVASVPFLNFPNTFLQSQTFSFGITVAGSFTAPSLVTNADLANPSVAVNGVTCTLGSTCTILATATNTLTFGTHLTAGGSSYNGSSPVTITSDATNANTASTIVARDGSGNFSAGTITASLTGHASLDLALSALGTGIATALGNNLNTSGGMISPTLTRAGDIIYWNGINYVTLAGNNSGTQVLQENSSGVPSWATLSGTGTVTEQKNTASVGLSTSGNCDNISSNSGSPCDTHLALNNAVLQANPTNPTACATATCPLATGVMAGLGSTCHLTPTYSGRIEVTFYNGISNSSSGNNNASRVFFGTGTAPANAAAITGTQIGQLQRLVNGGVNFIYNLANGGIALGLTPGTAYWFDESQQTDGGTIQLQNISCTLREF